MKLSPRLSVTNSDAQIFPCGNEHRTTAKLTHFNRADLVLYRIRPLTA